MENGAAYVSPPALPPQAHLSAAFQAASGNAAAAAAAAAQAAQSTNNAVSSASVTQFQEALMSRMGRPFGLSVGSKQNLKI